MARALNLILITYLESLKETLRGPTHKHAVVIKSVHHEPLKVESKLKPRSTLDSPCHNFDDTATVVFGCLIQTPQLQSETKGPTAMEFHPGLLQFGPEQDQTHHIQYFNI